MADEKVRKTKDGQGVIVEVQTLHRGDELRAVGNAYWPIVDIEELPKSRRLWLRGMGMRAPFLMRRNTLVARRWREGEKRG